MASSGDVWRHEMPKTMMNQEASVLAPQCPNFRAWLDLADSLLSLLQHVPSLVGTCGNLFLLHIFCYVVLHPLYSLPNGHPRSLTEVLAHLGHQERASGGQRLVDARRLYLLGFSMGSTGAWALASAYPRLFAAIVSCSRKPAACRRRATPEQRPDAGAGLLYFVHGKRDQTIPAAYSKALQQRLDEMGAATQSLYVKTGHGVLSTPWPVFTYRLWVAAPD